VDGPNDRRFLVRDDRRAFSLCGVRAGRDEARHQNAAPARRRSRLPARAHGAHLNHFEAFPFFAAAVIIADVVSGPSALVNWLAVAFVVVRLFYTAMYVTDRQPLRSASFFVGLLIVVAIFISPVFR
jgi:uncharacterized MAPEG superfamily protein